MLFCVCLAGFVLLFTDCTHQSDLPEVNTDADRTALKGYDPVAYFTDGMPVKGDTRYRHEWKGAVWLFAGEEHKALFASDPVKYAPQYGGYCAYAVSQGTTADIDPESWTIVNGKLYLNLDRDVQRLWEQDISGYIRQADRNWPAVLKGK